jgi:hypothetical protein
MTVLAWLESSDVARIVSGSLWLTAILSAVHLLGFTLLSGAAFVLHLRLSGAMLRRGAVSDISRPAALVALGLVVSIATDSTVRRACNVHRGEWHLPDEDGLVLLAVLWQSASAASRANDAAVATGIACDRLRRSRPLAEPGNDCMRLHPARMSGP